MRLMVASSSIKRSIKNSGFQVSSNSAIAVPYGQHALLVPLPVMGEKLTEPFRIAYSQYVEWMILRVHPHILPVDLPFLFRPIVPEEAIDGRGAVLGGHEIYHIQILRMLVSCNETSPDPLPER